MADQLQDIVQRMVAAGESEDDIALVIKSYKPPDADAPAPKQSGFVDRMLADNPALPPMLRGTQGLMRIAKRNPVATGATIGGALATGGASIPAQMGLAALGAAGGTGYGMLAKGAQSGNFGTPSGNAATMATEGAAGAAGQGMGAGAAKILQKGGKLIYKTALRPSMGLQREFGDVAETGLREGVTVSQRGAASVDDKLSQLNQQVRNILTAKDAERPIVRGLLPPAQGVALGRPPIHPTMPELRDPRSAGVLLGREAAPVAEATGEAAHGSMIAPAEISRRGLGGVRSELSDRALAGEATDQLGQLEQRFLNQRNRPLTLVEAQRMKRAEQGLSDAAYRAEQMGHPVNGVEGQFHKGIARGTREAIEQRVPEVGPLNQQSQELIGLVRALEDANRRNVPAVGSLRTLLGDFVPSVSSRGGIAVDRAGKSPVIPASFRTALIAALGGSED